MFWPRLLITSVAATIWTLPAFALEGERTVFPAVGHEMARLNILAATDTVAMQPLILDFQQMSPGIAVEYTDYVTNDLFREAEEACASGAIHGDLLISSSVDQLVKLANDGCASPHMSEETLNVPDWANWREEVYGFTFEPAVMVYDSIRVPPEDVPRSHDALADLLRRKPDVYRGRIGTYDIKVSGVGYLLAFNDALQAPTVYGRLLESLTRADAIVRCCNSEVLNEIATGNIRIAYNILGSYAYAAAQRNPNLKIVIPRDYTVILPRSALIPSRTARRDLAVQFLDYLLSERGQTVGREKSFFFSQNAPLPSGVDGPNQLMSSGVGRPIHIGPALLAAQDRAQRERFINDWARLLERKN